MIGDITRKTRKRRGGGGEVEIKLREMIEEPGKKTRRVRTKAALCLVGSWMLNVRIV